jgi:hypothetical protein
MSSCEEEPSAKFKASGKIRLVLAVEKGKGRKNA